MSDTWIVSFNAGCTLFLIQAKFSPFVTKLGGFVLIFIITADWKIRARIDIALIALYNFHFFKKKSS